MLNTEWLKQDHFRFYIPPFTEFRELNRICLYKCVTPLVLTYQSHQFLVSNNGNSNWTVY